MLFMVKNGIFMEEFFLTSVYKFGDSMKKIIMAVILLSSLINAQNNFKEKNELLPNFSGALYLDQQTIPNLSPKFDSKENEKKKSPILAASLSLVLPGAGEFYSERYLKSAIFLAAEITAISVGLIYDKKGDDQTNFFQNFANQHWSVDRYAKWVVTNATKVNSAVNPANYNVFVNGKVNWNELNRLESDLGSYFSHRLPYYGEQQYYELIGKYPQFNVGWDDFGDENTPFEYDPTRKNLTKNFVYYSIERGKANDYYNIAAKAVVVVIVNHFISSLDAAWSAHNFNRSFDMNVSLEKFNNGLTLYYYPQLNLQYKF